MSTQDLLSTPRWKRIKSESPSNAESTRHLDSSNQYNPQVKNEPNDNLDRLEDAKALSQDFDVALEKHSSHQKPYWRRKTGGGNAGLENVKTVSPKPPLLKLANNSTESCDWIK